jgi:hypothetical protein
LIILAIFKNACQLSFTARYHKECWINYFWVMELLNMIFFDVSGLHLVRIMQHLINELYTFGNLLSLSRSSEIVYFIRSTWICQWPIHCYIVSASNSWDVIFTMRLKLFICDICLGSWQGGGNNWLRKLWRGFIHKCNSSGVIDKGSWT